MNFFCIPDELILTILSKWMLLQDVALFDTAICNHRWRPGFLRILSTGFVFQHTIERFKHTIERLEKEKLWLQQRNIQIQSCILDYYPNWQFDLSTYGSVLSKLTIFKMTNRFVRINHSFAIQLINHCSTTLKEIHCPPRIRGNDTVFDDMLESILSCKQLEYLDFQGCDLSLIIIKELVHLKTLHVFVRSYLVDTFPMDRDKMIKDIGIQLCRLENIQIFSVPESFNMTLFFPYQKNLKHVTINSIDDNDIYSLASNCPHLTTLSLHMCDKVNDVSLVFLVSQCRFLTTLELDDMINITDVSLHAFGQHPLSEIRLVELHEITSEGLESLSMKHVRVVDCNKITTLV